MSEDPGSVLVERAGEAASQGRWPQAFALLTEAEAGGRLGPAEAERETRARPYRTLDLVLNPDSVGDPPTLDVRLQLCGGGGRI